MTDIINNPKSKDYCIDASDSRIMIKNKAKHPTKMINVIISGKNGVQVNILYMDTCNEKDITINTGSTSEDVEKLRFEVSKFFDSLLPGIIMINSELDENRKK